MTTTQACNLRSVLERAEAAVHAADVAYLRAAAAVTAAAPCGYAAWRVARERAQEASDAWYRADAGYAAVAGWAE